MTAARTGRENGHADGLIDLQAAAAAEVSGDPFRFRYGPLGDLVLEVPAQKKWPVKAIVALDRGDLAEAFRLLLGADAFDQLCDAGLEFGELEHLMNLVAKEAGLDFSSGRPPTAPALTR